MALKCADLGHLAREEAVHIKWVRLLEEEVGRGGIRAAHQSCQRGNLGALSGAYPAVPPHQMFRQGDLEKARGHPVSPLMDRSKEGITRSQPGVSVWGGELQAAG